jgi:molybdenum cofactor cytidylyltransferase
MSYGAVVLAAGLSRRMGKEKVLLPFGQATVLERILATLAAAGVSDRVVVLRPDLPRAIEIVQRAGARFAVNPHPEEEMLLSIRIGMAELPAGLDAFFVWPADHPAVENATLEILSRGGSPARVAVPTFETRRGHPALVGGGLKADIDAIPAGQGLRHLWRLRPEVLLEVAVPDRGVLLDLNTPEDYDRAIANLRLE